MSHVINPTGFRVGKTFLWDKNTFLVQQNNDHLINKNINLSVGLEAALDKILNKNNNFIVKSSIKQNNNNIPTIKILYYPNLKANLKEQIIPKYNINRKLLNKTFSYNNNFKTLIKKIWLIKKSEFRNRFLKTKKRLNITKWFTNNVFRGNKVNTRSLQKTNLIANFKIKKINNIFQLNKWRNKFLLKIKSNKKRLINYTHRNWRCWATNNKKLKVSNKQLSKQLSKRIGMRVEVNAINVFTYLFKKKNYQFNLKNHQNHIWNKTYSFHRKNYASYFDIVNSLFILAKIPYTENLVTKLIHYNLLRMHKRRRLKPKPFFYFLAAVLKNMRALKIKFKAFRIIITGKLQGGTSRTKIFNIGFGNIPRQSIDKNIRYSFENLHSKYGSFGIKLMTWRKSRHELLCDRKTIKNMYFKGNYKHL